MRPVVEDNEIVAAEFKESYYIGDIYVGDSESCMPLKILASHSKGLEIQS